MTVVTFCECFWKADSMESVLHIQHHIDESALYSPSLQMPFDDSMVSSNDELYFWASFLVVVWG